MKHKRRLRTPKDRANLIKTIGGMWANTDALVRTPFMHWAKDRSEFDVGIRLVADVFPQKQKEDT